MRVRSLLLLLIFVSIPLTATAQTTVEIPDPNLRAAIAEALGKAPDDPILRSEMATLTRLSMGDAGISDLTGLEWAINLTGLNLEGNSISDISPLTNLTNLTVLALYDNSISDISPLTNLTNLTGLALEGNSISDISPLANLTNLTVLALFDNSLSNISPLADLTNLKTLFLSDNSLSDLSPLANLTNLTYLVLSDNPLSDISALANLTNLTTLYLNNASLSDISALANLTNLTTLLLSDNSLSDISALANLTNLTQLRLRANSLSDISPLANLTNLTYLVLHNNSLSDISPLANLTNLTSLTLHNNSLSDISPLANLTNLTQLGLVANPLSDISPLADLTNLTRLNLSFNSISDISPLANLINLSYLNLERNPLNYPAMHTHIPALEIKGVSVSYDDRTPASLHKISGDETASDNSLLIVEVKGSDNRPFEGVPVTFAIVSGGGALGVTSTTTDAQGRAQSELTLGSDGEPNRVTASVVPFGLEALFTVGQSVVVDIPDPNLRAAIADALGKAPDDPILASEMATLTELAAGAWAIRIGDLTGLEEATNLSYLHISNTSTLDLSPLADLTNLTTLTLSKSISDLSSLADLTNLTALSISPTSDISPLASLTNLTTLTLGGSISDLSPLADLTNLTTLTFDGSISDLSLLPNLTNLTAIRIYNTSISDLSPLAHFTNLTQLDLTLSSTSDLSPLANLTNLTDLTLYGSTWDISPLANLTNLTQLRLGLSSTSDLSPLANLTNLTQLSLGLSPNSTSDLSPLANLTNLTQLRLDLSSDSTWDISPLANLTNLTQLSLGLSSTSDISPLANLTNLTDLTLYGSTSDISPLTNLTNLTWLNLRGIPLSYPAILTHIPALQSKGVHVSYDDRTPASLHKISGDETATENSLLIVEVKGSKNRPFEGVPVTFAIVSGGGALGVTSTTTDAQGRAQSELTLGSDGEPNRVTVSVVPFGLEALFSVGQSAVDIPDLNLRAAIADALGKALNDTFFTSEMATLTELEATRRGEISDLTGLERATNLTSLALHINSTSDISPLVNLTNLTTLTLYGSTSDLSPLANLTNLTVLSLRVGSTSDLSALAGLTNLRELSLGEPHGLDSSTLPSLTNLQALSIWGWTWRWAGDPPFHGLSGLLDPTFLAGFPNLTELTISNAGYANYNLSNISPVAGLSRLKKITLSHCLISDISPLVENTGLGQGSIVDVRGNPLSYVSLHTHIPDLQSRGVTVHFDDGASPALLGVSGDYQNGAVSTPLPQPLVIEAHDENGFAVAGVQVEFTVSQGDGALGAAIATTGENGRAQTTLTLGPNPGTNSVHVYAPEFEGHAVFHAIADSEMPPVSSDVNDDGTTNILDLVLVSSALGSAGDNLAADVNGDGVVDILDLVIVAGMLGDAAAAPSARLQALETFTEAEVKQWLNDIRLLRLEDPIAQRGIMMLERLLALLIPEETELLANYPNPFNPETWIPYRLAESAFVTLTIYDLSGQVVRTLDVGRQIASTYENRSKAIYWDGRNELGQRAASGVYFYHLSAGDYSATRKMLILK